jgi:hypothetical protein
MAPLRLVAIAMFGASTVLVAGCAGKGGDLTSDGSGDASTTSLVDAGGTSTPETTQPTDPAVFDATIARLTAEIDESDADLCELIGILDSAGAAGNPTTKEQAQAAARFLSVAYSAIADAAPASSAADAKLIREAAASMAAETDAPDFDLDAFMQEGPAAFKDERFLGAMSKLFSVVNKECGENAEP